ncbi:MAG: phosphatase PAP2 family protein [Flavobacteriales bacterium]|nr:phosphatase PAP2 family protein [Flavobacteriales bacterium]
MNLRKAVEDTRPIALPFVVGLSIYSILGLIVFVSFGKEGAHKFLNAYHTPYLDLTFKYITHLGNGLLPILLFHLLLLVRYSWALGLGISSLVMGVVVQTLKRSVFAGDHRPAMFFPEGVLPHIDGVDLMLNYSFPSGHSATAFCIFFMLAFFVKQKWATYTFMVLALLIAFSRVYISQHFIQDTVVGSWIGLVLAYLGYLFIVRYAEENPSSKLNKRLWPS